jgi:hypothetical protein
MSTHVSTGSITITDVNDGGSFYTAAIYLQQILQPTTPTGGSYNFRTKTLTLPSNIGGWSATLPASSSVPTWRSEFTFSISPPETVGTTNSNADWSVPTLFVQNGLSTLTASLSNDSQPLSADSEGTVAAGAYATTTTFIYVAEGTTPLTYDGYGIVAGNYKITAEGINITVGDISRDSVSVNAFVSAAKDMLQSINTASIAFTITGKTLLGKDFTLVKTQTFSKSKGGAKGTFGPTVSIASSSSLVFLSTDRVLNTGQAYIAFTATVANIGTITPTYAWKVEGFDTNTATGTGSTFQLPPSVFTSTLNKSAGVVTCTVTCGVLGSFADSQSVHRQEVSTAYANATVGATYLNTYVMPNITPYVTNADIKESAGLTYVPSTGTLTRVEYNKTISSVNNSTHAFGCTNHGFITGSQVTYTATGTAFTGLGSGSIYYVIHVSSHAFSLANTAANALAGIKLTVSGTTLVGTHTISPTDLAWVCGVNSISSQTSAVGATLQFTAADATHDLMLGLSNNITIEPQLNFSTINYAINLTSTGTYRVYEDGVSKGTFGYYEANDVFHIIYDMDTSVSYYKNGENFYIANVPLVTTPVNTSVWYIDGSFKQEGASVKNIGFSSYQAPTLAEGSAANIFGKIFPGNIANYLSNAVIGNAYIANLAVTSAKIGNAAITKAKIANLAVDTLQIAGDAVMVPLRVTWYSTLTIPSQLLPTGYTQDLTVTSFNLNMLGGTANSIVSLFGRITITPGAMFNLSYPQDSTITTKVGLVDCGLYTSGNTLLYSFGSTAHYSPNLLGIIHLELPNIVISSFSFNADDVLYIKCRYYSHLIAAYPNYRLTGQELATSGNIILLGTKAST